MTCQQTWCKQSECSNWVFWLTAHRCPTASLFWCLQSCKFVTEISAISQDTCFSYIKECVLFHKQYQSTIKFQFYNRCMFRSICSFSQLLISICNTALYEHFCYNMHIFCSALIVFVMMVPASLNLLMLHLCWSLWRWYESSFIWMAVFIVLSEVFIFVLCCLPL